MIVFEARSELTGSCGLARIDVADNDHVDVHLLLTIKRRAVSRESIKICEGIAMMFLMLVDGIGKNLTHPMVAVLFIDDLVWFLLFFGKKVNLLKRKVSIDDGNR
jgi:hypothetical protein